MVSWRLAETGQAKIGLPHPGVGSRRKRRFPTQNEALIRMPATGKPKSASFSRYRATKLQGNVQVNNFASKMHPMRSSVNQPQGPCARVASHAQPLILIYSSLKTAIHNNSSRRSLAPSQVKTLQNKPQFACFGAYMSTQSGPTGSEPHALGLNDAQQPGAHIRTRLVPFPTCFYRERRFLRLLQNFHSLSGKAQL